MIPLFRHYPLLADKLPYISLAELPTPVTKLERLGHEIGLDHIYMKRDDLSGKVYGGNKLRKLEFILADALRNNTKEVLTFGFAGSNHALATAIYAQKVGMKSISMLTPQPNASYVRRNLLMSYHCGAELNLHRNKKIVRIGTIYQSLRHKLKYGHAPYIIPPGASLPLGAAGFINAAFELKEQIVNGQIPEPDRIYIALGTTGTAVGLMIGLRAANLKSRLIPVRIIDEKFYSEKRFIEHFTETVSFLKSLDPSFPVVELTEDIGVVNDFLGKGYAHFTGEGTEALNLMEQNEGIKLDGTYTGKTVAALINDARKQDLRDKVVLFWNTLNSRDFSDIIADIDYHNLPKSFHCYFEEEVQPLDRI